MIKTPFLRNITVFGSPFCEISLLTWAVSNISFDVNDDLLSILAICDLADMKRGEVATVSGARHLLLNLS